MLNGKRKATFLGSRFFVCLVFVQMPILFGSTYEVNRHFSQRHDT